MSTPATVPSFAELAGDLEARLMEGARLFHAMAIFNAKGKEGAKMALIGATDSAARENTLRWLEAQIAAVMSGAEIILGARSDSSNTAEWDMEACLMVDGALRPLLTVLHESEMVRMPEWPSLGKLTMDVCDPTIRGEATRLLRDMWWMQLQSAQVQARKKPGQFLAGVGITDAHVTGAMEPRASALVTVENPPDGAPVLVESPAGAVTVQPGQAVTVERQYPPMPERGEPKAPLPGQRVPQPTPDDLAKAFELLAEADFGHHQESILAALTVSKSTFHNWRAGRTKPRITPAQARVLAAECARAIADIETAEGIFKAVTQ